MPRPRKRTKPGPKPLSDDVYDKFLAAMSSFVRKDDEDYPFAPFYYDAVKRWFDGLSLDDAELVGTVFHVYVTPSEGGLPVALTYAGTTIQASEPGKVRFLPGGLPPAPPAPKSMRKKWGFD